MSIGIDLSMNINKALVLLLLPATLYSQQNSEQLASKRLKKYDTPSAELTYVVSGAAEGKEVLLFDRNGWRALKKQTITFEHKGLKTLQTLHEVTDGNYVFRLNGGDSTYTSKTDFKWSQLASTNTPEDVSQEILFMIGGTYTADSTLLGKPCQVWTFTGKSLKELWIWNQLVLKRKILLGDKTIVTTAEKIALDVEIDPAIFEIPLYFVKKE